MLCAFFKHKFFDTRNLLLVASKMWCTVAYDTIDLEITGLYRCSRLANIFVWKQSIYEKEFGSKLWVFIEKFLIIVLMFKARIIYLLSWVNLSLFEFNFTSVKLELMELVSSSNKNFKASFFWKFGSKESKELFTYDCPE